MELEGGGEHVRCLSSRCRLDDIVWGHLAMAMRASYPPLALLFFLSLSLSLTGKSPSFSPPGQQLSATVALR